MRSVFDQYSQMENKLTHALACALHHEPGLLRAFLRWIEAEPPCPIGQLVVQQQTLPGQDESPDSYDERRGLPDLVIHDDESWAVLIESKVQSKVSADQLRRHSRTAGRRGFEHTKLVVIAVDEPGEAQGKVRHLVWRDVYALFSELAPGSFFAAELAKYMRALERQMIAQEYQVRGTLTKFTGLRFDQDEPYSYPEAKRLIRLLGDKLQRRKDLAALGADPTGARRTAITGRSANAVWDFIPLKVAKGANNFTDYPHLTLAISRERATATITVPNGVRGGFKSRLKNRGFEGFEELVLGIEENLRPLIKKSHNASPVMYVLQRHYKSQRSQAQVDATVSADLRTLRPKGGGGVKHQPQWAEAIYELLTNKRSNLQFGIELRLDYACPIVRSPECEDLFAGTWIACAPLIEFVLDEEI